MNFNIRNGSKLKYTIPAGGVGDNFLVVDPSTGEVSFRTPTEVGALGITGSTGSADNAVLRADGTGGLTIQSSPLIAGDDGSLTLGTSSTSGTDRFIVVDGSGANINLDISSKGSGNLLLSSLNDVFLTGNNVNYEAALLHKFTSTTAATSAELRLYEGSTNGSNYIGIKPANSVVNNITYTLPEAPSVSGYVLSSTTAGVMSWIAPSGGSISGLTTGRFTYATSATTIGDTTLAFDNSSPTYSQIAHTTSDGADNMQILLCGGGNSASNRGGSIAISGNEFIGQAGLVVVSHGNVANARVQLGNSTGLFVTNDNVSIGGATWGTSASKVLSMANATAPTTNVSAAQVYSSAEVEGSNIKIRTSDGYFAKPLLQTKVTITGGATLRNIGSTPATLIAAPGANKYINIINITTSYNYGAAVYDFGANGVFRFNGGGAVGWLYDSSYLNAGGDINAIIGTATNASVNGGGITVANNTAFELGTVGNVNATTGDGDLDIVVYYTIEATNT